MIAPGIHPAKRVRMKCPEVCRDQPCILVSGHLMGGVPSFYPATTHRNRKNFLCNESSLSWVEVLCLSPTGLDAYTFFTDTYSFSVHRSIHTILFGLGALPPPFHFSLLTGTQTSHVSCVYYLGPRTTAYRMCDHSGRVRHTV